MAQAILNFFSNSQDFIADSCGIYADGISKISNNAKEVLKNHGIDFDYTSKPVSSELINDADIVICMTQNHYNVLTSMFHELSDKIFIMPKDISDPYGGNYDEYESCYNEIYDSIKTILSQLNTTK